MICICLNSHETPKEFPNPKHDNTSSSHKYYNGIDTNKLTIYDARLRLETLNRSTNLDGAKIEIQSWQFMQWKDQPLGILYPLSVSYTLISTQGMCPPRIQRRNK